MVSHPSVPAIVRSAQQAYVYVFDVYRKYSDDECADCTVITIFPIRATELLGNHFLCLTHCGSISSSGRSGWGAVWLWRRHIASDDAFVHLSVLCPLLPAAYLWIVSPALDCVCVCACLCGNECMR